jgi:hypothetical protein
MNRFLVTRVIPAALLGMAAVAPAAYSVTVTSAPYGVVSADAPAGNSGLAAPLISEETFTGRVASNDAGSLTFEGSVNVGVALAAGQPFYLEVLSGPLEGERLDVNAAATIAAANATVVLDLGASSNSTIKSLAANVLAQTRCAVRPHLTLAKLQNAFSPALVGNNAAGSADLVKLIGAKGLTTYQLRGDNATWRESGKTADVRNLVIPPDVSVMIQLRSGAKRWANLGAVRTTAFRKNLSNGLQGFATGYPVDMSPAQIAAFVDAGQPAGTRWTGSDNPDVADTIKVFDSSLNDYKTYYLRADGATWNLVGDTSNVATAALIKPTAFVVVSRNQSDGDYLIVPPFTL